MANRILTGENWQQRIREKIGVDSEYLPDSSIDSPDCIMVAEANIISQIPDYATLTNDLRVYLEYAVVLECCILLCPSMGARLPKKETGVHASYELGIDWSKKKEEFEEERNRFIGKILEEISPAQLYGFNAFTITYPKRGW
ncbi:MAG TPA: hypothetical protein GYA03_02195 [Tissierellia bacterium]|nr:hypothetical protein [Tissierellia bacterium]